MTQNPTIRLALADDHAVLRRGLAELLSGFEGLEVILEADNGQELLDRMHTAKVLPDVCILDIGMPVLDGYDTARAIRGQWPDIKILALSMFNSEYNIIKMLRSGAGGYVLKDAEPMELIRAIREIYSHSFYHSELVNPRMLFRLMQPGPAGKEDLTANELQFLKLLCSEHTYKEIAEQMNLSPRTIDDYRNNLFLKLNIRTRTGLVMYALKTGIGATL